MTLPNCHRCGQQPCECEQATMPSDAEITAKVAARIAAGEVCRLAESEAEKFIGDVGHLVFWKKLLEHLCEVLPDCLPVRTVEVGSLAAMSDPEGRDFERDVIEFGKYVGKQIKDVPLDYLCWLDEQPNFRAQLNRYLRSERIQREQGE